MVKFINENDIEIKNNDIRMRYDVETDNLLEGESYIVARYDNETKKIKYYLEVRYDAEYYGEQIGLIELDFDLIKDFKKNVEMLASNDSNESNKGW